MKQEKLEIVGRQGLAIPNALIRQDNPSGRLAILFPGLTYRNSMPALYYPHQLLLARGCDVLMVNYAYDQIPEFGVLSEEEKVAWIGAEARAVMGGVLALDSYEHFTLVGKSLGTAAMAAIAPDEPRLASADLIWLTPGFKTHGVLEGMARCPQRSVLVLGTADPHYEEPYVEAARASTTVAPFVCDVRLAPWPDARVATRTRRSRRQARYGADGGVWRRGGFPGQTIAPALQPGFVVSFLG